MNKKRRERDKYGDVLPRKRIAVGEYCSLMQCSSRIRKAARPFFAMTVPITLLGTIKTFMPELHPGMQFTDEVTGECFEVHSVLILSPEKSCMKRIK